MVEKRWRVACEKGGGDDIKYHMLPNDSDFGAAFSDRKKRLVQPAYFIETIWFDAVFSF